MTLDLVRRLQSFSTVHLHPDPLPHEKDDMPGLVPNVDPDGLLEYSVVYTDRSLNHMSRSFQGVMNDISATLKKVYNARSVVIVPGSGTFGMEAVARQFATGKKCLVLRNGWFSFRWTQILDVGHIPSQTVVLQARRVADEKHAPFAPAPLEDVLASIAAEKPDVVFAPHVDTSSGIILPDEYVAAVGNAVRSAGGLFVVDCIASGTLWLDMEACGIDVLISAPQKGWSGSPCCALVMLSGSAREKIESTASTSFACDLLKWLQIMEAYEKGGHAYHATMPTDALTRFRDVMNETVDYGLEKIRAEQQELGDKVRALLVSRGLPSVAAEGFQAPGVVVSYTDDVDIHNGRKFAAVGVQIAAGVPLRCDEPEDFRTFRLGLFGLEKLRNVERAVTNLDEALSQIVRNDDS
jgi:aspartate aminotransferase-like enzyme